ncbi:hypothetical protein TRFO_01838 [Tritrichomonas foetus]|uniref:Uncharacterized protein n=1 Tax=Tritrichomonas foetus TaxID=1144522 RepID=A0A1J4JI30_9EUKA|nr:hypothetical protein TRFO_01838 [Tritrichomonas foetus]|eukprot:OHS98790.1 hypothetical protein TRFO_01838 [Tritrichomonas foetus]
MDEVVCLFDALLMSFLESFSQDIDQAFSSFENFVVSGQHNDHQLDEMLQLIFTDFPSKNSRYNDIISTLTSFATSSPVVILSSLCTRFKNEFNRSPGQPSNTLTITSLSFKSTNFHHFQFLRYLVLFVLTDLIYSIFKKYPNKQPITKMVPCGYSLCTSEHRLHLLQMNLINKWSDIFRLISQLSLSEISLSFEQYSDDSSTNYIYCLVSKVNATQTFIDSMLFSLQQSKKHKIITSEMFSAIASLLAIAPCEEDVLNEFFNIAWNSRNTSNLKDGAIDLICVLLNRLPAHHKKASQFYPSRVYKHASEDQKVERSARSFLRLIRGDISKINQDQDPLFLGSSGSSTPNSLLNSSLSNSSPSPAPTSSAPNSNNQYNNQSSSNSNSSSNFTVSTNDSYSSIFMKVFFAKSNFNVCINLFSEILAHLASIDINSFEKNILPSFLKSNVPTAKFITLIKSICIINSETFLNNSICQANQENIKSINQQIKSELFSHFKKMKEFATDNYLHLTKDVLQLQSTLDESDHIVLDFLTQNNYLTFDTTGTSTKYKEINQSDAYSLKALLHALPYVIDEKTIKNTSIVDLLIRFLCHNNFIVSSAAHKVYYQIMKNSKYQMMIVEHLLSLILGSPNEVSAECLYLLLEIMNLKTTMNTNMKTKLNFKFNFSTDLYAEIEFIVFCCFVNDLPYCRTLSLRILKHLSAINEGSIYRILHENSAMLSEAVNRSILVLNVPAKPSMIKPPLGYLDFEHACCSRYNDLWLIFLSEIYNILIENECDTLLIRCRHLVQPLSNKNLSPFTTAAVHLLYIDSFAFEVQENSESNLETNDNNSDSNHYSNVIENKNQSNESESSDTSSNTRNSSSYDTKLNEFDKDHVHLGVESLFHKILSLDKIEPKKILMHSFCFLNWRVIPSVLPYILSIENDLYPDAAAALSFIIQNPENFNHIISSIFRRFIEFLSLLQSYFIHLQINSAREINWDEEHKCLLRKHQDVCINYCILISAAFNNIQDQIPEDEWPLSYRQVLVQFLIHWAQLPDEFEKIQAYAVNALIPIIHAGTVFTDGFSFELPMLEMMVKCQLSGYPVLDSLLLFHLDILLDEFVKCSFLRNKRESQLFLEAILGALEYCEDASVLQNHVGSLLLLALFIAQDDHEDLAQKILTKVSLLFLDKPQTNNQSNMSGQQRKENNSQEENNKLIFGEDNFSIESITNKFQFATEQVIEAGFDIIRVCSKITVSKSIVTILSYFFDKIRLLPTHLFIVQGVPSKFRKYTVISFFDAMYSVSSKLSDELHEVFSQLWYNLLQSTDNSVVILLCLFESDDDQIKEKIFTQLLEKEPAIISKYLAKRCTFAYWYFLRTQRQQNVSKLTWALKVLTHGFIDYVDYSAPNYTTAIHFSLLFIEEASELFEALIAVFGLETVDSSFIWTKDGASGTIHAASIVSEILTILMEQKPEAVEKWSQEAIKWAIACCDIKIGYRSLVIFNSLQTKLPTQYIPLLAKAVSYHLSRVSDDDCEDVALFIGECFDILNSLMKSIKDIEVTTFAFKFASLFLKCPSFEKNCLSRAMPIFLECLQQPVLMKSAQDELSDAFIPFLRNIENDDEAQALLGSIIEMTDSPDLLIVAACFLLKPLPFIHLKKTYKEIITTPITSQDATKAIKLLSSLIKTASRQLVDSIIEISTELLKKFEHSIDQHVIVPIYSVALQKVPNMKSAVDFMTVLLKVIPGISTISTDTIEGRKFIDDVKKSLNDLLINETKSGFSANPAVSTSFSTSSEVVPITNCKQILQLNGLIDQQNPPKILPFSSHYEMYVGLRKNVGVEKRGSRTKRWSSSLSLTSGILSNRSMIFPSINDATDFSNLKLEEIPKVPLQMKLLDIPTDETGSWQFIVSAKAFLELDE